MDNYLNILPYTHSLEEVHHLIAASLADPLTMAFNVMIKDPLHITRNKCVLKN